MKTKSVFTESVVWPKKDASFAEVLAFCKAHPEEVGQTEMGREVLRLIKAGQIKRLKKFWLGAK